MSDTPEPIEREIRIAARPEIVFGYFTDPEKMVRWKGTEASLDPTPGGLFRVRIGDGVVIEGRYLEIVPYQRVVFAWGWQQNTPQRPPDSSTVTITLSEEGGGTLVRLRHQGLPAALRSETALGWDHFLPRLVAAAERESSPR